MTLLNKGGLPIITGDKVEIKEATSGGKWVWSERFGHVVSKDEHCFEVRADDGELVRDVREHFRHAQK